MTRLDDDDVLEVSDVMDAVDVVLPMVVPAARSR